jgi:hypothetical protein
MFAKIAIKFAMASRYILDIYEIWQNDLKKNSLFLGIGILVNRKIKCYVR